MQAVHTGNAPAPAGHYSQAVRAGQFLFVSGQLPIRSCGAHVTRSPSEQTTQALENVKAIVEAAGGSMCDLVQANVYVTSVDYWPEVNSAYLAFLRDCPIPPARAVVPVKELHYGFLVEIQAVAYLP